MTARPRLYAGLEEEQRARAGLEELTRTKEEVAEQQRAAGSDEGLVPLCLPSFLFIWRTPMSGTNCGDE